MSIKVDVGTPPKNYEEWETIQVRFHGFADLSTTRGEEIESPAFSCFGHQWALVLCPGGSTIPESPEGCVAVNFCWKSPTYSGSIKIQYGYGVRNKNYKEATLKSDTFGNVRKGPTRRCLVGTSVKNFAKRSTLINSLVEGTLVIEIRMRQVSTDKPIIQFIPSNPINKNVLELFMDEDTADVVFEVGGQQQTKGTKRAKTSTTSFHAHRLILKKGAPTLSEMCGVSEEGITTVSIKDVTPDIFKHMLYYAYGGKLSEEELGGNAKEIINACDKYGVVHLKLEAEAAYVNSTEITLDNMMDNLLYADSKNLALLKEAVMDYIVANKDDVVGKVSFSNLPSYMMTDLLAAVSRGEQNDANGDKTNYNKMRVGTLRKMLDEKGLDVDGSRESMIALLKENSD